MFNQIVLNAVVAEILGICPESFQASMDRGMRPVKAALKLGADVQTAQLVGSLQLAISAKEIDTVYADERTKSCMVGQKWGSFTIPMGLG